MDEITVSLFPSQFFKITMIIGESKDLHKEPLIIYFSVVKYRVVWLQWSITKVTLLQFIHENADPAMGKVQTLSSLHSHFSQVKVLNILLKKVTMQYNAMSILSGWISMLWCPLIFFLITKQSEDNTDQSEKISFAIVLQSGLFYN